MTYDDYADDVDDNDENHFNDDWDESRLRETVVGGVEKFAKTRL